MADPQQRGRQNRGPGQLQDQGRDRGGQLPRLQESQATNAVAFFDHWREIVEEIDAANVDPVAELERMKRLEEKVTQGAADLSDQVKGDPKVVLAKGRFLFSMGEQRRALDAKKQGLVSRLDFLAQKDKELSAKEAALVERERLLTEWERRLQKREDELLQLANSLNPLGLSSA